MTNSNTLLAVLCISAVAWSTALRAQSESNPTEGADSRSRSSYVIGPDDTLLITVADEAELTGRYRVDSDGCFTYPYLGRVVAGGKSVFEVEESLRRQLASGYLRKPQVRVEVDQYRSRSVFVTGEVRNPNEYVMTGASMTLLQALAVAGSPTQNASSEIIVSRQSTTPGEDPEIIKVDRRELELGRSGFDLELRDGDVIHVPAAQRFYVDGAVRKPGYYVLDPGLTVQQAIVLAGGLSDWGSDRGIVAVRMLGGKSTNVSVHLTDPVQPNDIIRVRQRFF